MNECNDPDHGAINAERSESRGLRKAWIELDDKRQQLERELTAVTYQRDRLAEAMRQMWPFIEEDDYPNCNTPAFNAAILKYKEALQSLTTNEQ